MPSDGMEAVFRFERNFKTVFPSREVWQAGHALLEDDLTVFTDGSKKLKEPERVSSARNWTSKCQYLWGHTRQVSKPKLWELEGAAKSLRESG